MTEGKSMQPTSGKDVPVVRTAGDTHALGGSRIASSSLVAGSPNRSDHQVRVALIAYYKAQQREFAPGHDWEDWFAAEREVAASEDAGAVGE